MWKEFTRIQPLHKKTRTENHGNWRIRRCKPKGYIIYAIK
jgi:hypothetical protein